jgi:hypothetical protein
MPPEEAEMTTLPPDDDPVPPPSPGQSLLRPGSHRHHGGQLGSGKGQQQMRLRLIALTFVALLALTSIAVISQQLFHKYLGGLSDYHFFGRHQANGTGLLWPTSNSSTRSPLRARMLRHINRTRGAAASAEDDYDYYGSSPPEDIFVELADRLVDPDGCWSAVVENYLGRPDPLLERVEAQIQSLREQSIVHLEAGEEAKRCAGSQNGFVLFQEGLAGCVRYREPHQQLVLGEVLSYYLARLLGLRSVPPAVLSQVSKQP